MLKYIIIRYQFNIVINDGNINLTSYFSAADNLIFIYYVIADAPTSNTSKKKLTRDKLKRVIILILFFLTCMEGTSPQLIISYSVGSTKSSAVSVSYRTRKGTRSTLAFEWLCDVQSLNRITSKHKFVDILMPKRTCFFLKRLIQSP